MDRERKGRRKVEEVEEKKRKGKEVVRGKTWLVRKRREWERENHKGQ